MAVTVQEKIMEAGSWSVDLKYSLPIHDALVDERGNARSLHMLLYDNDDNLRYVGVLRTCGGDEKGLTIGGPGPLWHLGTKNGPGPLIVDREYVSGQDKLSNGTFVLGPLYWREPAEGSLWNLDSGRALNPGGLPVVDDVLESDERFPTRPGYQYRLDVMGITGTGYIRSRLIFEGRFNPPDLMINGGFDDGTGWFPAAHASISAGKLHLGQIPKEEIIPPSGSDFSAGWTLGPTMSEAGGALLLEQNPKPQLLPGVEGDFTPSPFVFWGTTDPAHSLSGTGPYRIVGPITQQQFVPYPSFDGGLAGWVDTPSGSFAWDATNGLGGTGAARHDGSGTGFLTTSKILVCDFDTGVSGTDALLTQPGDEMRIRGSIKLEGGVGNGQACLMIHQKQATASPLEEFLRTTEVDFSQINNGEWYTVERTVTTPSHLPYLDAICVVDNHTGTTQVFFDNVSITRVRGNNTGCYSPAYPAIENQTYRLTYPVDSDPRVEGSVTARLIFEGPGKEPVESRSTQPYTFDQWVTLIAEGSCPPGYTTVKAAFDGDDIQGGAFYIDVEHSKLEKYDNNTDRSTYGTVPVLAGQDYELGATFQSLATITDGSVTVGVVLSGDGVDDETISFDYAFADDDGTPQRQTATVTPRPDYTRAAPFVVSTDLTADASGAVARVTDLRLTKMDNNAETTVGTGFFVIPQRTYRWVQAVSSGLNLQGGTVHLSARCIRADHPDVVFDSPSMEATQGDVKQIDFSFTPPSGYDVFQPRVVGVDIAGDEWTVDDGSIRDTDSSTYVVDTYTVSPTDGNTAVEATAPAGSEYVRAAIVLTEGARAWTVTRAKLSRIGVTPATGDVIVRELLTNPRNGAPLSLAPGTISCSEVPPYDWPIANMTDRDALDRYCNVVSIPRREYKVNPTLPPTIDIGVSEAVFVDHNEESGSPIVLLAGDLDVAPNMGTGSTDVSERPTEIRVLGAVRKTVSGRDFLISASAAVPGAAELDFNGRPIERVKTVSDASVDHAGYADALAADLAAQEGDPPLSRKVTLAGTDQRPPWVVGDWVYAYHPEAGLQDRTNPVDVDSETVWPGRYRILDCDRSYLSGRIFMRKPDGSTFPLPDVQWSEQDSATLTIGTRLNPWEADPQGQAPGVQYLQDRAHQPR